MSDFQQIQIAGILANRWIIRLLRHLLVVSNGIITNHT